MVKLASGHNPLALFELEVLSSSFSGENVALSDRVFGLWQVTFERTFGKGCLLSILSLPCEVIQHWTRNVVTSTVRLFNFEELRTQRLELPLRSK
eukprot:833340-Amphidinium_carterae.1